jgi:hypothetical protein
MDNFSRIFQRLDIRYIREFLICGEQSGNSDGRTYAQRIDGVRAPLMDMITEILTQKKEYDAMLKRISQYEEEMRDVYMEVGMQCGAALAVQLLGGIAGMQN